jgi:hypothetical protein
MPPEMIYRRNHNKSLDWWELGIFLYELRAGANILPFEGESLQEL